ncbi:MAG: restriction endonuclease [Chloroflexi bacterium]|nr:restriction endonuclease [Chloroflexota bacterium]
MIKDLQIPWQRYALIVELAQRLQTKRSQFGKTALQKLIYLLQEVYGVKCGYDYKLYTYGPFTSQVLQDLDQVDSLSGVDVTSVPTDLGGYRIEPGKNAAPIKEKESNFIAEHEGKLERLINDYGAFSAKELELRATAVYVARDMQRDGKKVTVEALTQMVHDIKPYFPREEIQSVVEELQDKGHIKVAADG